MTSLNKSISKTLLKEYIQAGIYNYTLENPSLITKTQFYEFLSIPLQLSNRFSEIIFSEKKENLEKKMFVEKFLNFILLLLNEPFEFVFNFYDYGNKKVLIKSDVKFILKNFYVFYNKNIFNYDNYLKPLINKMFNSSKIILKEEFLKEDNNNELKLIMVNCFMDLKFISNFNFFCSITNENNFSLNNKNLLLYFNEKENDDNLSASTNENDYIYNKENREYIPKALIQNRKFSYSFKNKNNNKDNDINNIKFKNDINNNLNENFEILNHKTNRKKTSFQLDDKYQKNNDYYYNSTLNFNNNNKKYVPKYNFYCLVKGVYILYRFIIYNEYIFYFKYDIDNTFKFEGIIIINFTHITEIKEIKNNNYNNNFILYHSSINSHIYFNTLHTDIYSYNMLDIENFSYEISKYSKFKKFSVDYKILEQIGKGHFSIVLKAKNLINNKIYAVKVLDIETLFDNEEENIPLIMWERTIFEYIKNVPCKYIIKPIEYYETSNNIYFVYEYLPNGKLNEFNIKNLSEISEGLLYLKKNNILHRDIKPENILLDSNNEAKIIDFGLSKIQRRLDKAKEYYGSLSYMAPEIFEGRGYSNEVDVWSFGIMMHYLKYNNFPFDDSNDNNDIIRENIKNKEYKILNDSKEDNIIKKCLEKNENERIKINDLINKLKDIS